MIFGLEPQESLPDNWTPLESIAVTKCLNAEGEVSLVVSCTEALNAWESVGMLTAALDAQRSDLMDMFVPGDE